MEGRGNETGGDASGRGGVWQGGCGIGRILKLEVNNCIY